ncbi:aspartate/glutamate racemase family protein [Polaribacter glomeratus]|uniref:Aspartate racemase n=1 Tax=Polaribacter glomeratus TaxID=102 RepID=A0A2S7WW28_9FLAO|nr:aspartate/glutamate racemase family protein [Polaribacter glomeratus]PQJ81804.1 aspartate racemase [Polaribacter glomeratus]TXD66272.1 aspartate/glutamate racemase family protein [Polaribacter glomeratus]
MKKIGLIGGITPESTILYYRILNQLNATNFGKPHSAEVIINSFDFGDIAKLQKESRWDLLNEMMFKAGENLEAAGADCILICANTMHLCIDSVRRAVNIPVIHIAEATSKKIIEKKLTKVALIGTKYTMEKDFFKVILTSFGIETIIPELEERDVIHSVIYDELSVGKINPPSKEKYLTIIDRLISNGAEGIILGCTEIPLLIEQKDVSVPVFDTTKIHATSAYEFSINNKNT